MHSSLLSTVVAAPRDRNPWLLVLAMVVGGSLMTLAQATMFAQDIPLTSAEEDPAAVLRPEQWVRVDASVDRALRFLANAQQSDGSFACPATGQPGATSLAVLAFLSKGHLPGHGPYGDRLLRAIDYVLSKQSRGGMFSFYPAEPFGPQPANWDYPRAHAFYNHAISGLMLTEVMGSLDPERSERCHDAIERALACSRRYQNANKPDPRDNGGWRYMFINNGVGSDLSVTAWQLMFFRSAKNAEFDVPKQHIDEAMAFVRRCYDPQVQRFRYSLAPNDYRFTRAMSGAGILSLSLGGEHNTPMAQTAATSLLRDSFASYNTDGGYERDEYHYSVYYCTLGMFQMGGEAWKNFYPPVVQVLLDHQQRDGGWEAESSSNYFFGRTPSTAFSIMALSIADQLVPIYQR